MDMAAILRLGDTASTASKTPRRRKDPAYIQFKHLEVGDSIVVSDRINPNRIERRVYDANRYYKPHRFELDTSEFPKLIIRRTA